MLVMVMSSLRLSSNRSLVRPNQIKLHHLNPICYPNSSLFSSIWSAGRLSFCKREKQSIYTLATTFVTKENKDLKFLK